MQMFMSAERHRLSPESTSFSFNLGILLRNAKPGPCLQSFSARLCSSVEEQSLLLLSWENEAARVAT